MLERRKKRQHFMQVLPSLHRGEGLGLLAPQGAVGQADTRQHALWGRWTGGESIRQPERFAGASKTSHRTAEEERLSFPNNGFCIMVLVGAEIGTCSKVSISPLQWLENEIFGSDEPIKYAVLKCCQSQKEYSRNEILKQGQFNTVNFEHVASLEKQTDSSD